MENWSLLIIVCVFGDLLVNNTFGPTPSSMLLNLANFTEYLPSDSAAQAKKPLPVRFGERPAACAGVSQDPGSRERVEA